MPVSNQVAVGDTATEIIPGESTGPCISVVNRSATAAFIGGADVTADTGFELKADEILMDVQLAPGEELWGICATGETTTVHFLVTGQPN